MLPINDLPRAERAQTAVPQDARRVAIVTAGLGAGGAEQVIAQLARHWTAQGLAVDVVTFDRPGDPVFHALPHGVALHRLGGRAGLAGMPGKVAALRRCLARCKPQVVVSFLTKINLLAALACTGRRVRLVCSERNNPERQDAHPLWNLALRLAYRRADAIVCQTAAVRRCFAPGLQGRLVTIPNPVPPPDVAPCAGECTTIGAVGRLTRQKGFDVLLRAFGRVHPRHPAWRLAIWGDGPDRQALEDQIAELGLSGAATLRGLTPRPRSWVAETGIFVLSSRYEGFPNALGEAMAAGLPVVSADCDFGPADMIEPRVSGLLVPPEDDVALAAALETFITDAGLRARAAASAAAAMERFGPARVLRLWDEAVLGAATLDPAAGRPGGPLPATSMPGPADAGGAANTEPGDRHCA